MLLLDLQLLIESCTGSGRIGSYKEVSDAQCEDGQKPPSDEAEFQAEQLPTVATHHFFGPLDALISAVFRVLGLNEGSHGIAVRGYNAGDDEQQRPQKDKNRGQQLQTEAIAELVELREKRANSQISAILLIQQIAAVTQLDGAADDELDNADHNRKNENGVYNGNDGGGKLEVQIF